MDIDVQRLIETRLLVQANSGAGRPRTLGLADYPRPGLVRAADLLFPGGAQ